MPAVSCLGLAACLAAWLAAWVGCLGWLLGLATLVVAWCLVLWLVCLKIGCLELDKACYLTAGRRLKGPFESCAFQQGQVMRVLCVMLAIEPAN